MGLVKFNGQTLNIAEVPDGHQIISETEFHQLSQARNSYLSLKSRLPIGVDESQVSFLIEKGQRFDAMNSEFEKMKITLGDTTTKLSEATKNLPEGFNLDKWNSYVQRDKIEVRTKQIDELTKSVMDKLAKENPNVPLPKIDQRFLDVNRMNSLDTSSKTAEVELAQILADGYKAQIEFLKNSGIDNLPSPGLGSGVAANVSQEFTKQDFGPEKL